MSIHGNSAYRSDLFLINGVEVVLPSEMTYTRTDLDSENSFRSITSDLHRDRIGIKRKLDCQWSGLSGDELATLLQAMNNVFFTVKFIDPYTNDDQIMVCYVGDRSPVAAMYKDGPDGLVAIYENFSCSFIEK